MYSAVAVGLPLLSTGAFLGMGRYVLAAFPVFAAAGDLLAEPRLAARRVPVLAGSGIVLSVRVAVYARGLPTS